MSANDFVLVQGLRDTRGTLERWNRDPWPVFRAWALLSAAVAAALLGAVWVVATLSPPDPTPLHLAGVTRDAVASDIGHVLFRNSLVLTLHALACVAGFIAGSSLPLTAQQHSGVWRRIHELAGPIAIAWVMAATIFSLSTQAFVLGSSASTLANQLALSPAELITGLLPHAIPELTALFLPLAAWTLASRADNWHELLAATFATVAVAVPTLVVAAFVEVYVSPRLILALAA